LNILRLFQKWMKGDERGTEHRSSTSGTEGRIEPPARLSTDLRILEEEVGPYDDVLHNFRTDNRRPQNSQMHWVQPGEVVTVAGRSIPGMVYLGSDSTLSGPAWEDNSFIDPKLRVAKTGADVPGDSMSYWPSYGGISPQARAAYLDWLADGRRDKQYGVGYVFLFFYGLERRFFVDSPSEEEKRAIAAEVEELLLAYGENRPVRGYLGKFLDTARIVLACEGEEEPSIESEGYEIPLELRVAIGRMTKKAVPLTANWVLAWYSAHPDYTFRMPARRASKEFRTLFRLLFDERYPKGLKARMPKGLLNARYRASSRAFDVDLKQHIGSVPDISRLTQPLNAAEKIVDEATDALDRYSRYLGRNPDGRDSIDAHVLLPKRLWPSFPCPELEELRTWAEEVIRSDSLPFVEEIIERLEDTPPKKVSKRQLTRASDALARLAIGMAPDPRFALRTPRIGDPVVLFDLPEDIEEAEQVSEKYKNILITVALGSFVAGADGSVATMERNALRSIIDSADVSFSERERLIANLNWMTSVPPDLAVFRRHLKDIPEELPGELARVALSMAAVDNSIAPREIKAIERLYEAMGLNVDDIYAALHELTSVSEPVVVREAEDREADFIIPARQDPDSKIVLDADRVASIRANTERVSSILGVIFQEDDAPEEQEEVSLGSNSNFQGLDAKHADFVNELLTRPHWEEDEFEALTSRFNLMPGGALETVNEWSFARFDDLLIEEYEGYELNPEVSAELRA